MPVRGDRAAPEQAGGRAGGFEACAHIACVRWQCAARRGSGARSMRPFPTWRLRSCRREHAASCSGAPYSSAPCSRARSCSPRSPARPRRTASAVNKIAPASIVPASIARRCTRPRARAAATKITVSETDASRAHRRCGAPRNAIARVRCEGMPPSPPRATAGFSSAAPSLLPASRRTPVYEATGGIEVDQFRAVGCDGDCRVLRLPRNKTPADQRLAYMKLTASLRGAQDQLVSRMRCSATLARLKRVHARLRRAMDARKRA